MKAVRLSRSLVVATALVASLVANVTLFVGGVVYSIVDEFVDGAFGLTTAAVTQRRALTAAKAASAKQARALAASKAVAAKQRGELSALRGVAATQRREIAALKALTAKQRKEITALRAAAAKRSKALNDLHTDSVRQGRKLAALRTTSGKAAKQSRDRLVASVGRSILTAPGKALPYAGIAIVGGLTMWEIKDLCATIRDMDEIQKAAGTPEAEVGSELIDYCVRPDLAVEHAVGTWKSYPGKEWREYKKYVPDLPGWEDIPDSWREAWRNAVPDSLQDISPGILDRMKRLLP